MKTGVYQILNLKNNKFYIGSTAQRKDGQRRREHWSRLRRGVHYNIKLQNAWNKYGESNFIFELLEECEPKLCIEREQYYLDILLFASCNDKRFYELGYNICRVAGSNLGVKYSLEVREANSKRSRGSGNPMYGKASAMKGKKHSKGTLLKMSTLQRGSGNPRSKLTNESVIEIKRRLEHEHYKIVAQDYSVHYVTIHDIKQGKTWRHIK